MSRYFTCPVAALWVGDEYYSPEPARIHEPFVPEHVATDTGLLDKNGDAIMRAARPVDFGRDAEW